MTPIQSSSGNGLSQDEMKILNTFRENARARLISSRFLGAAVENLDTNRDEIIKLVDSAEKTNSVLQKLSGLGIDAGTINMSTTFWKAKNVHLIDINNQIMKNLQNPAISALVADARAAALSKENAAVAPRPRASKRLAAAVALIAGLSFATLYAGYAPSHGTPTIAPVPGSATNQVWAMGQNALREGVMNPGIQLFKDKMAEGSQFVERSVFPAASYVKEQTDRVLATGQNALREGVMNPGIQLFKDKMAEGFQFVERSVFPAASYVKEQTGRVLATGQKALSEGIVEPGIQLFKDKMAEGSQFMEHSVFPAASYVWNQTVLPLSYVNDRVFKPALRVVLREISLLHGASQKLYNQVADPVCELGNQARDLSKQIPVAYGKFANHPLTHATLQELSQSSPEGILATAGAVAVGAATAGAMGPLGAPVAALGILGAEAQGVLSDTVPASYRNLFKALEVGQVSAAIVATAAKVVGLGARVVGPAAGLVGSGARGLGRGIAANKVTFLATAAALVSSSVGQLAEREPLTRIAVLTASLVVPKLAAATYSFLSMALTFTIPPSVWASI